MSSSTALRTIALAHAFAAPAAPASAGAQALGTAASYTGSRTGSVLDAGGNYTSAFSIAWSITSADNGLLRYTYTLTGFRNPGISHLIVGLSDDCRRSLGCVLGARVGSAAATDYELGDHAPGGRGNSNPGLAGAFYGVKFNTPGSVSGVSGVTFSFLSDRAPVFGDFYAKGGNDSYAQNDGLLAANRQSNDVNHFVARPDTHAVVPEPSTYALLGTGLAGLLGVAARRRGR